MPTIVITGCSSGFGRLTAFHLAQHGWHVLATVRQEAQRAELLAEAAARQLSDRLTPILCDITLPADVQRLAQAVVERGPGLDALLNNAGTNYPGPLELLPLDVLRTQFEINLLGHLSVTQALLPALKTARGAVLNVSSTGGSFIIPLSGPYAMSKVALEAMSDVLRLELAHFGVKVIVIVPGPSPTPIWENSLRRAHSAPTAANLGDYAAFSAEIERRARLLAAQGFPPELFARTVLRILNSRRPASVYYVPGYFGFLIGLRRLMPNWLWDAYIRRTLNW